MIKKDTLVILGAAALAVFAVFRFTRTGKADLASLLHLGGGTKDTLNNGGTPPPTTSGEIPNPALPGQPGYGWRNFADGTSISPQGDYYMGGALVWQAPRN